MSTPTYNRKTPTLKRILREATELASTPSTTYHATPLETDLFEWHFTILGPPSPSPYAGGIYHGRIVLPPSYPLKPPSFRFLTPTGRFEVNREICLSISGHHEESWQPAWGIRTALVAIRSFMDTSAAGQLGGMEASDEVRKRMALASPGFMCQSCGKKNGDIMEEVEAAVREAEGENGGEGGKEEEVPEALRLQYREDLGKREAKEGASEAAAVDTKEAAPVVQSEVSTPAPTRAVPAAPAPAVQGQAARRTQDEVPAWIDKAIYGVAFMLVLLVFRKWLI